MQCEAASCSWPASEHMNRESGFWSLVWIVSMACSSDADDVVADHSSVEGLQTGVANAGPGQASNDASTETRILDGTVALTGDASRVAAGRTVALQSGLLLGTYNGQSREFRGIPYAKAPVGNLRFARPRAADAWTGTRTANVSGPACPQPGALFASEDCLTLDVFAPATLPATPLPVMVFIHGGGFTLNGAAAYSPRLLSEAGDVIVVRMNYRLGALGFLTHPALDADLGSPSGNLGLYDQQAALRWVRENIAAFGGNPRSVTVFGQSAGAISACLHMFATNGEDLADRFILMSGACYGVNDGFEFPVTTAPAPRNEAIRLGSELVENLCTNDDETTLECLHRLPPEAFVGWVRPGTEKLGLGLAAGAFSGFGPHVDGALIVAPPIDLMRSGRFAAKPLIAGFTTNEWELFAAVGAPIPTRTEFVASIESLFAKNTDRILAHYMPATDEGARSAYIRVMSDYVARCPMRTLARHAAARGSSTYLYEFGVPPAAHSQDLDYLFDIDLVSVVFLLQAPLPLLPNVVDAMQGYWSSFARIGDPNGARAPSWHWPSHTQANPKHLVLANNLDTRSPSVRDDTDCEFWETLYPGDLR